MDEWKDIRQSKFGDIMLAYKADLQAATWVINCLEGLPELQAMHGDLKSRCMRIIIFSLLETVAPIQRQLPPLSAFYTENTTWGPTSVVSVNDAEFERHREACVRTLDELRDALQWIHEHLELWHAQEAGKISGDEMSDADNVTENMVYSDYKQNYTALMSRYPQYPMLSTNNSHPPLQHTRVSDEQSVQIMHEIDLYCTAYGILWEYCNFVESIPDSPKNMQIAVQTLRQHAVELPSAYELRDQTFAFNPAVPPTKFYRTRYAVYPFGSSDRLTRPIVLSKAKTVLECMQRHCDTFRQALPALPVSLRLEHDGIYNRTVSAFEAWSEQARPLSSPSQADLRRMQEGRRPRP
jgi:hypothetical protein